jgi:hypothetical protein
VVGAELAGRRARVFVIGEVSGGARPRFRGRSLSGELESAPRFALSRVGMIAMAHKRSPGLARAAASLRRKAETCGSRAGRGGRS